jgi:hypothetical protein
MAALALSAVASAALPWWSTRLVDRAYDNLAAGRPEQALVDSGHARTLNPLSLYPLQVRASAYRAVGQTRRALGVYLSMTRVQPDNPASWRALARYLGDDRRAVPVWRQVRRLDPRDLEAASHGAG